MSRTKAWHLSQNSKGSAFQSGAGYKGVLRRGSKYGWKFEDGRVSESKGGFDTPEEAAYNYDEWLIAYAGPDADTNQALGLLKEKHVIEIREKLSKTERALTLNRHKSNRSLGATGFKGVSNNKSKSKPYRSQIMVKGKSILIGTSQTAEAAARMYDAWVLKHLGHDAETNVKLGLLPPVEIITFKPSVKNMIQPRGQETRINIEESPIPSVQHSSAYKTPEEERLAQIEAARLMADEDETQEETGAVCTLTPSAEPAPVIAAPLQPEKPAQVVNPASPPIVNSAAAKPSALASPADLVAQAALLIQQAANQQRDEYKARCIGLINTMLDEVKGYQVALDTLIDRGAAIEKDLAELKKMLED